MTPAPKDKELNVGMIFGGRSVEHEVSVITALQAAAALPRDRYRPVPLYIAKSGAWYTGDVLLQLERFRDIEGLIAAATPVMLSLDQNARGTLLGPVPKRSILGRGGLNILGHIDVAFPLVHGSHGEDGTLQGLLEMADLPYVGCGVAAAALGMDKPLFKAVMRSFGLPVLDDITVTRQRWRHNGPGVLTAARAMGVPLFVKPANLGSSIGVSRVTDLAAFGDAMDLAMAYADRVIIEPAQEGAMEVNCAVMSQSGAGGAAAGGTIVGGADALRASVCEQPVSGGLLSYEDKYMSGGKKTGAATGMEGARRIIPAPLDDAMTGAVQEMAMRVFRAINAAGVARVDLFVRPDTGTIIVNEINTMPGSLAFYLWEPAGVPFPELVTTLIESARTRDAEKRESTYSIDSWLLENASLGGTKGDKRG